jgi:MoaA/NifB/PqqE/SkfB family radical SAM enzyme
VSIIPPITGLENLKAYYNNHQATFGYNQCVSIYQVVEVNSNGDVSPCRDYHDYVVGNVREHTVSELWNSERYVAFQAGRGYGPQRVRRKEDLASEKEGGEESERDGEDHGGPGESGPL